MGRRARYEFTALSKVQARDVEWLIRVRLMVLWLPKTEHTINLLQEGAVTLISATPLEKSKYFPYLSYIPRKRDT